MERHNDTVASIIQDAVDRICTSVAKVIAERAKAEVVQKGGRRRGRKAGRSQRQSRVDLTQWVADRNARRVPNFVIEATGLKTKKKIVAKYGKDAVFKKGGPLPEVE